MGGLESVRESGFWTGRLRGGGRSLNGLRQVRRRRLRQRSVLRSRSIGPGGFVSSFEFEMAQMASALPGVRTARLHAPLISPWFWSHVGFRSRPTCVLQTLCRRAAATLGLLERGSATLWWCRRLGRHVCRTCGLLQRTLCVCLASPQGSLSIYRNPIYLRRILLLEYWPTFMEIRVRWLRTGRTGESAREKANSHRTVIKGER